MLCVLFLLYINDVVHVFKLVEIIVFVDTNVFFNDDNLDDLCKQVNAELGNCLTGLRK